MTELETAQRAKMYMDQLARGIDPISGRVLPGDSALNNARLSRCFSYVSGILDQVIRNGGQVGQIQKSDFSISPDQLARVQISARPVRVTEFADVLLQATGSAAMKRPSSAKISNWLTAHGFLAPEPTPDGKSRKVPTAAGLRLGITAQMRQSPDGDYLAIYYDANAQRFLLENLFDILAEK